MLRPHLTVRSCGDFDYSSNECTNCQVNHVLDVDESPYCAWNRRENGTNNVLEKAILFWSKNII